MATARRSILSSKTSLRRRLTESEGAQPPAPSVDRRSPVSSSDYLFHLLVVVARLRDAELDRRLLPLKLNVGRYRTLATLDEFGPCTMSIFTSYSPLDRTTITRTVDHLVRAGWASRTKTPEDRRQIYIALTEVGAELYRRARDVVSKYNDFLVEGMDEELQAQVIAAGMMFAAKLESRSGQFVDRQSQSGPTISKVAMVS